MTPDHVNPEAPWPEIERLRADDRSSGQVPDRAACHLSRICARPPGAGSTRPCARRCCAPPTPRALRARSQWAPGLRGQDFATASQARSATDVTMRSIDRVAERKPLPGSGSLDDARSSRCSRRAARSSTRSAPQPMTLRRSVSGDTVSYVVNRNINYTNICNHGCRFCAFSKGKLGDTLRGPAYDLDHEEIARRVREAWDRGATEVCMQGGIHPRYTGATYLGDPRRGQACGARHPCACLLAARSASWRGKPRACTSATISTGCAARGSAACPAPRRKSSTTRCAPSLCPDKLRPRRWLAIVETAHRRGLRTTATIMFGHIDRPEHWARHLLHIRDLQERTGGFTEFVPLPFVHMEAPLYLKGRARKGPTLREAVLMHAVARLALHPLIPNIQVSWVKLGPQTARRLPRRRRQRSRRHADEREHLARRRHRARPGAFAGTDGCADRYARPHAAASARRSTRTSRRTPASASYGAAALAPLAATRADYAIAHGRGRLIAMPAANKPSPSSAAPARKAPASRCAGPMPAIA